MVASPHSISVILSRPNSPNCGAASSAEGGQRGTQGPPIPGRRFERKWSQASLALSPMPEIFQPGLEWRQPRFCGSCPGRSTVGMRQCFEREDQFPGRRAPGPVAFQNEGFQLGAAIRQIAVSDGHRPTAYPVPTRGKETGKGLPRSRMDFGWHRRARKRA